MRGYQNIVLNGKDLGVRKKRRWSKFYNQGKWDNFILPLLPKDPKGLTFMEIGCNLGMYLKMAKDIGMNVIGVEADEYCCRVAREYSQATVIQEQVGKNSSLDYVSAVDYVLLANVHYHMSKEDLRHLLTLLKHKARHIIVVSAESAKNKVLGTRGSTRHTRQDFSEFHEVKYISGIPYKNDKFPRRMFSILYQNDL